MINSGHLKKNKKEKIIIWIKNKTKLHYFGLTFSIFIFYIMGGLSKKFICHDFITLYVIKYFLVIHSRYEKRI